MEIYGTIGPACESEEKLQELFEKGMTGIRMNLSHGMLRKEEPWILHMHRATKAAGVTARFLIDLQGPELRVGRFAEENIMYELREEADIFVGSKAEKLVIPMPQAVLKVLSCGQEILLDDGKLLLQVTETGETIYKCKVIRGGRLASGKSIALPDVETELETLTAEDLENLQDIKKYGVTDVMLPFVRGKKDIEILRQTLQEMGAPETKILAKIENCQGIRHIDEIIDAADMVVIARGDLGNAVPLWELPGIQKTIAQKCRRKNRQFMVVTQMLASMEHSKVPTRAEVSDIFNAVLDGADAVMLTGETAIGEYPAEAMEYLVKTVQQAQRYQTQL